MLTAATLTSKSVSPSKKACLVCNSPEASAHFGTVSCLACAAFFRRTVSLNITFRCAAQKECRISYELRMICRSCRFQKCLDAGMKPQCVQKRKAVPSKKSRKVEKESPKSSPPDSSPSNGNNTPAPDSVVNDSPGAEFSVSSTVSPAPLEPSTSTQVENSSTDAKLQISASLSGLPVPNLPDGAALLSFFVNEEKQAVKRRRVMFTNSPMRALMGGVTDVVILAICQRGHSTLSDVIPTSSL
jgi:hypothetical protein